MSNEIIVGVTGAPVSRRAVDWAGAHAERTGRKLVLFAVVGGAVGSVGEKDVVARAETAAWALVDAERDRLRAAATVSAAVEIETRVAVGNPTAELIAASQDAAYLVIGSDQNGPGSSRGAHGRRIVAGAHSSVVVVPDIDVEDRRGVVVGVDGSAVSHGALELAALAAARTGQKLTVASAWMPVPLAGDFGFGDAALYSDPYLTDLEAATTEMVEETIAGIRETYPDLEIEIRVEQGEPAQLLLDLGESARLVVVGTHGHGALARFLLGSVSEHVIGHLTTVSAVVRSR